MDERELQEAVAQYKQQLDQIELLSQNDGSEELRKLKDDLVELVRTTEESLLCVKKSKLLKFLNDVEAASNSEAETSNRGLEAEDCSSCEQSSAICESSDIQDAIAGTQCKAPYTFEWGVTGYYNAMVLGVEEVDEKSSDVLKVQVLFMNPTHRSMVPCPYFLDEKCRFDADECRYSHGYIVNMADLKAYEEPDFSLLKVDGKCLAKYEDGVWYKATILSMTAENATIHYDTYNMDKCVTFEDILPLEEHEGESSDEEELKEDETEEKLEEDKVIAEFCHVNSSCDSARLGDWEKHTKGIASKLMAKMGYVFGKGLGRNEDGRVEPVEIILLPTGKSLDACAQLREKNKLKEPFKRKKRKSLRTSGVNEVPGQDMFEFINKTLGGRQENLQDLKQDDLSTSLDRRKSRKSEADGRNFNVELLKLEQEKCNIQKLLNKQKDSVLRNNGKNAAVLGQAKQKITRLKDRIAEIEAREKLLRQKIHARNEHKKLTVF